MMRRRQGERGAALVETVILLPLLVLLAFGIVDVGRLVFTKITLNDAAQEGSLYGAYNPTDYTVVEDRVITSMDNLSLTSDDVFVECATDDGTPIIRVTVSKDMSLITPVFTGKSISLSSTVEGDVLSSDACDPEPVT